MLYRRSISWIEIDHDNSQSQGEIRENHGTSRVLATIGGVSEEERQEPMLDSEVEGRFTKKERHRKSEESCHSPEVQEMFRP